MTGGVDAPERPRPAQQSIASVPGIKASFLLVLLAFAGFSLLLPVVPLAVLRSGGDEVLAGATTGVFMVVTVLFQLVTPRLTARAGYKISLLIGSALLGLPSAALLLGLDGQAGHAGAATAELGPGAALLVLAVSAVRGAGFGMMTVSGSALVAELAPPGRLGRATSMIGVAVGASEMVFLPAGLVVFDSYGLAPVAWLASALGLAGLFASIRLPDVHPHAHDPATEEHSSRRSLAVALIAPFAVMLAVSVPYGAISAFFTPALAEVERALGGHGLSAGVGGIGLGLLGAAVICGRAYAGRISDSRGPGHLVIPGLLLAAAGVGGIAALLAGHAGLWWFLVPCVVFGAGFGIIQNEALVTSFELVPRSRLGTASASWNISFDAGTGAGSLVLGVVAGWGYVVLFVVATAVVAVIGVPAAAGGRARTGAPRADKVTA